LKTPSSFQPELHRWRAKLNGVSHALVIAPDPDLADLIAIVVQRAGHDPLMWDGDGADDLPHAEVVVIDVSDPAGRRLVPAVRRSLEGSTLVLIASHQVSDGPELGRVLAMPFELEELREAVAAHGGARASSGD
jgi:DNA-binding response OmpR family regulator